MSIRNRKAVARFAKQMEYILRQNDHKGGWKRLPTWDWLFDSLVLEVFELNRAIMDNRPRESTEKSKRIIKECVDISNFAMMIADNEGLDDGLSLIPEEATDDN